MKLSSDTPVEAPPEPQEPSSPPTQVAKANQPLPLTPKADLKVDSATEDEVIDMLREETLFGRAEDLRVLAARLLGAGYSVSVTARKLGIRPSTLLQWSNDDQISTAIALGREYRRRIVGQRLEDAASSAIQTLIDVATDDMVNPKDRVKASEAILDRCGLVENSAGGNPTAIVAVDVDFDERLARIVASGSKKR